MRRLTPEHVPFQRSNDPGWYAIVLLSALALAIVLALMSDDEELLFVACREGRASGKMEGACLFPSL